MNEIQYTVGGVYGRDVCFRHAVVRAQAGESISAHVLEEYEYCRCVDCAEEPKA